MPGSAPPPGMESGDKIMIRGAPRSTPAVANFGDMGTYLRVSEINEYVILTCFGDKGSSFTKLRVSLREQGSI